MFGKKLKNVAQTNAGAAEQLMLLGAEKWILQELRVFTCIGSHISQRIPVRFH
jgi:hypothetical protein